MNKNWWYVIVLIVLLVVISLIGNAREKVDYGPRLDVKDVEDGFDKEGSDLDNWVGSFGLDDADNRMKGKFLVAVKGGGR